MTIPNLTADVIVAAILLGLSLAWCIAWLLATAAARRAPHDTPQVSPRRFYRCAQRDCTARATHIVLMIVGPTESRVVCWEDCQRLVRLQHAANLGPIDRPGR